MWWLLLRAVPVRLIASLLLLAVGATVIGVDVLDLAGGLAPTLDLGGWSITPW